jgi:hypothetical protein
VRRPERLTRTLLRALRFDNNGADTLARVSEADWEPLLEIADEARLTLPLGVRREKLLPDAIRRRIHRNLADNAWRFANSIAAHREIGDAFDRSGVPFLVLKGLSHFPLFCDDLRLRQQYDIDLYCPAAAIEAARGALAKLGYEPVRRDAEPRTDHLPTLVRKTGWRWRGDYYDPAMPLNVELHFRFWDALMEGFPVAGAEGFWERRGARAVGHIQIPALAWEDTVRYAAWHIARLLHATADDDAFWLGWRSGSPDGRLAEAIAARLACECFGCRLHPDVRAVVDNLPARVQRWFDLFAISPLLGAARPNKDELLLHLLLASTARDKGRIVARRLLPPLPPRHIRDPRALAPCKIVWPRRAAFLLRRAWFHLRALAPLARNGLRC